MNINHKNQPSYLRRIIGGYFFSVAVGTLAFLFNYSGGLLSTVFKDPAYSTFFAKTTAFLKLEITEFIIAYMFANIAAFIPAVVLGIFTLRFPIPHKWFYISAGLIVGLLMAATIGYGDPGMSMHNPTLLERLRYNALEFSFAGSLAGLSFWWKAGQYNIRQKK